MSVASKISPTCQDPFRSPVGGGSLASPHLARPAHRNLPFATLATAVVCRDSASTDRDSEMLLRGLWPFFQPPAKRRSPIRHLRHLIAQREKKGPTPATRGRLRPRSVVCTSGSRHLQPRRSPTAETTAVLEPFDLQVNEVSTRLYGWFAHDGCEHGRHEWGCSKPAKQIE